MKQIIKVCPKCLNKMSLNQEYYNDGVCWECGHDSKSTVCDTRKVIYTSLRIHPFWMFWKKRFRHVGINKFSHEWINNKFKD